MALAEAGFAQTPDARFHGLIASAEALAERSRAGEAEAILRLALRVRPGSAATQNALGMVLFDAGRFEEALGCFRRATEIDPHAAGAWGNAGMVLKTLDRFDEALEAYDRALALDPRAGQLRLNRAVALLRAGRMAEAWADYEARLVVRCHAAPLERLLPTLDETGPDLRGRSVLILHEEGFGDTLQFIRYAALLSARGARVAVGAPPELARLLALVRGVDEVIEGAGEPGLHDYVCPVFSLPRVFATTLESIPSAIPYLRAEPGLVAQWGRVLRWRDPGRLRVGLVWAGQARPWLPGFAALDRRRSAGLAALAPLAALDVEFVSLQKGGDCFGFPVFHDPMPFARDFADTAAVIAHLDVVVSVDTAVAHLAGGMGKPVLLLDRYDSCWRWLSGRSDSSWYPTLRIFRQSRPGVWDDPVRGVVEALAEMAGDGRFLVDRSGTIAGASCPGPPPPSNAR
jgi:hypothetical protein